MILHKILRGDGAGRYLPFALAQLRRLANLYGKQGFFQQKYNLPGFEIKVQQAPPFQYAQVQATGAAAVSIPAGVDVWYDAPTQALLPWANYTAAAAPSLSNSGFGLDDGIDYEGDYFTGDATAWWQINSKGGTLGVNATASDPATALFVELIAANVPGYATQVGIPTLDFSDCYVVASGTTAIASTALTNGKSYWVRIGTTDGSAAVYKVQFTLAI